MSFFKLNIIATKCYKSPTVKKLVQFLSVKGELGYLVRKSTFQDVQLVPILCNQGCVWVGQGDMIIVLYFAGQSKVQAKVRRAKRLCAA